MIRIRPTTRFSAFLLLLLTLHLLTLSLVLPKTGFFPLQKQVVGTSSLVASDTVELAHVGDFKPPKHSFIDYSTFFSPKDLIPAYNPSVSPLLAYEPFQTLPQVYLEITVPPDNPAC